MKIKELADIIYREALQDDPVSILVLGGPGVGKTMVMKESRREWRNHLN